MRKDQQSTNKPLTLKELQVLAAIDPDIKVYLVSGNFALVGQVVGFWESLLLHNQAFYLNKGDTQQ